MASNTAPAASAGRPGAERARRCRVKARCAPRTTSSGAPDRRSRFAIDVRRCSSLVRLRGRPSQNAATRSIVSVAPAPIANTATLASKPGASSSWRPTPIGKRDERASATAVASAVPAAIDGRARTTATNPSRDAEHPSAAQRRGVVVVEALLGPEHQHDDDRASRGQADAEREQGVRFQGDGCVERALVRLVLDGKDERSAGRRGCDELVERSLQSLLRMWDVVQLHVEVGPEIEEVVPVRLVEGVADGHEVGIVVRVRTGA